MLFEPYPVSDRERIIEEIFAALRGINDDPHLELHKLDHVEKHLGDSLDLADLAFRLESAYNVQIENRQLRPLTRIEDLADTIYALIVHGRQNDERLATASGEGEG